MTRRPAGEGARTELGGDHVEGRRAVYELLRARRRRVRNLTVASGLDPDPVLEEILELAAGARVRVEYVPGSRLDAVAGTDAPQGVVARADPIQPADAGNLLGASDAFLVALDGVTDPRNVGAILRSAESAGATGVIMPRHRAARLTPAAVKAAAGAVEYLAIASVAGIPAFLERASRAGTWSVGLDERGATSVFELTVADGPVVLVLGAEGHGLSRLTRERCDVVAGIPMRGALASLNVAAAAAVACFEVARRRGP